MGLIYSKRVLEELDGFDESLSYGEDADLLKRVSQNNYSISCADTKEYSYVVSSWKELWKQGEWYGKSYLNYILKHPSEGLSLLLTLYFISLPVVGIAALLNGSLLALFVLEAILFIYLSFEHLRLGDSNYGFFVPVIRMVRSWAIGLGILKGLFTGDLGKSS